MFIRAALYTAGYVALAALGRGSVSSKALAERAKNRGLGKWLFLCVPAISAAALFGGLAGADGSGSGWGDIAMSLIVMILPIKRRAFFDIVIPISVFLAERGYGDVPTALAGGFSGLAVAAAAEIALNSPDGEENRRKLKFLASATYAVIGIIGLCGI